MSRFHLSALLLALLCVGPAARTAASPADPANCDVPDLILLVGRGPGGGADPLGAFTVVIRDFNNVPDPNEPVWLDFRGCPDIRLCADQGDPGFVTDCVNALITTRSDQDARVTFRVLGHAVNLGASPGSTGPSLDVYADGILIKTVRVAALDQNGVDGVNPADLSLFLADSFSGQAYARSDYDGNGVLDPNDLSIWLLAFFAGGSATSAGPDCP